MIAPLISAWFLVGPVAFPAEEAKATAALASVETENSSQLSPEMAELRDIVRKAIALYQPRHLNTRDHNPWELMHAYVAFGVDTEIRRGGPDGQPVNAIAYVSINGPGRGQRLLEVDAAGRIAVAKGYGVQGHHGQFLAILAQSRVRPDYQMRVGEQSFTVADLIESEKLGCRAGSELTFKLISLAYYLNSNAAWKNDLGEDWSMERLLKAEIEAPINGAACGGTHRLMGLAYAVHYRHKQGYPIDGQFARAEKYLNDYHAYTFKMQNRDGSFSTEWFRGRGDRSDLARKLQTTGHILEWLSFSLSAEELQSPDTVRAVRFLSTMLVENPERTWEIGPLGHALHSLAIYDRRVFGGMGSYTQPIESQPAISEPAQPLADVNNANDANDDNSESGPWLGESAGQ